MSGTRGCCFFALFAAIIQVVSLQSCKSDILRFTNTGIISLSDSKVAVGDSVTVKCISQCTWDWHMFFVNGQPLNKSHTSSTYTNEVTNTVFNCPGCQIPAQQDCSDSKQGPVESTLKLKFATSGEYHVQCRTNLFHLTSQYWPNTIIPVYSESLKIEVVNNIISVNNNNMISPVEPIQPDPTTSEFVMPESMSDFIAPLPSSTVLDISSNFIAPPPSPTISVPLPMDSVSCIEASPIPTTFIKTITTTVTVVNTHFHSPSNTETQTDSKSIIHHSTRTSNLLSKESNSPTIMTGRRGSQEGNADDSGFITDSTTLLVVIVSLTVVIALLFIVILMLIYLFNRRMKLTTKL